MGIDHSEHQPWRFSRRRLLQGGVAVSAGILTAEFGAPQITRAWAVGTESIQVGAAAVVITPSSSLIDSNQIALAGFANRFGGPYATGVGDDIWARAVVIQDPVGFRLLILVLDVTTISAPLAAAIRSQIAIHGFGASNSVITAIHTHSAPVTVGYPVWDPPYQQPNATYVDFLQSQAVAAVTEAVSALQPANLFFSRTSANLGYERYYYDTFKLSDAWYNRDVDVIRAVASSGGATLATILTYGCHPLANADYSMITPDFPDTARKTIESELGGVAVYLQGFAGSVNPLRGQTPEQIGTQLASAVLASVQSPQLQLSGTFTSNTLDLTLPLEALPTDSQLLAATERANQDPSDFRHRDIGNWSSYVGSEISDGTAPTTITQKLTLNRLGTGSSAWRFVACGHEVVSEHALLLQQALPTAQLTLVGYSEDVAAYLGTQEMLAAGSASSFPLGKNLGDYEGGESFMWYGWPSRLVQNADEAFFTGASSLDVVSGSVTGTPNAQVIPAGRHLGLRSVYARGGDGNLYTTQQSHVGGGWSALRMIGGEAPAGGLTGTPSLMAAPGPTTHQHTWSAFARCGDGNLYATWQPQVGGSWNPWAMIGGEAPAHGITGTPAATVNPPGSPHQGMGAVYARATDGNLYRTRQSQVGGDWNPWAMLGGPAYFGVTESPCLVVNPKGSMHQFTWAAYARGGDGNLYTTRQLRAGGNWTEWAMIGGAAPLGGIAGSPTLAASPADTGQLYAWAAYARGADGNLYSTWQSAQGGLWNPWEMIGGKAPLGGILGLPVATCNPKGSPVAGTNAAYAVVTDGNLYTTWQSNPGGAWNSWTMAGGPAPAGGITGSPSLTMAPSGSANQYTWSAFARCGDGHLYATWQVRAGGGWHPWTQVA